MAIFHSHSGTIRRSKGQSSVGHAAYISGSRLVQQVVDKETGIVTEIIHDYTKKQGVVFSQVFIPKTVPDWIYDRQQLWNYCSSFENRKDAREAGKFELALPKELTQEQNIELATEIVETVFLPRGLIVDASVHYDNPENPHMHILNTTREIVASNEEEIIFGQKIAELNKRNYFTEIRGECADIINSHLELYGFEARVSHLSHEARGIDLIPGIHIGVAGMRMDVHERRVQNSEIAIVNAQRIIANPELVIDKLSIDKPVFTVGDIEKTLREVLVRTIDQGAGNKAETKEEQSKLDIGQIDQKIVELLPVVLASEKLCLVNACDLQGRTLYGLRSRIDLEKRFEDTVYSLKQNTANAINSPVLRRQSKDMHLSDEQVRAVEEIIGSSNIVALEGLPGAGKSTVMREVKRIGDLLGFKVIGTAPTSKASLELGAKVGIEVLNTTRLRQVWQKEKGYDSPLNLRYDYWLNEQYQNTPSLMDDKTILIMDEASTIDLPTMDYYLSEAHKAGAKVVLLGDNNQNPAVGSKGAFGKVCDIAGRVRLTEVNRHKNSDLDIRRAHIEATKLLGEYNVAGAIDIYDELGMIEVAVDEPTKRRLLVQNALNKIMELDKTRGSSEVSSISRVAIGAYSNEEVDYYNSEVRRGLIEAGIIRGEGVEVRSGRGEKIKVSVGEQILFKSNSYGKDGVNSFHNNELAEIIDIRGINKDGLGKFEVRLTGADGKFKKVIVDNTIANNEVSFKHGYALTICALQGASAEHKLYSVDKYTGYEAFNVGSTRHIDSLKIYVARDTLENEVYRLKSADTELVKQESILQSYKWREVVDDEGKTRRVKDEVDPWKIGLGLLASRRADLNFVENYRYSSAQQTSEKLKCVQGRILEAREQYQAMQSSLYRLEDNINKVNEKTGITNLQTNIQKYFTVDKEQQIFMDVHSLMNIVDKYEQGSINKTVASLKAGVITTEKIEKLQWENLSSEYQQLVMYSFMKKPEKNKIKQGWQELKLAQENIITLGAEYKRELAILNSEKGTQNHELTGNLGVIRDYLTSRAIVTELKTKKAELEAQYKRLKELNKANPDTGKVQLKNSYNAIEDIKEEIVAGEEVRLKHACVLIENYHGNIDGDKGDVSIGKYLKQLGCSYQTILRHAGIDETKIYFEEKFARSMIGNSAFDNLLVSLSEIDFSKQVLSEEEHQVLKEAYSDVVEAISDASDVINKTKDEIGELENTKEQLARQYTNDRFFENRTLPYYLSKIYNKQDGMQIRANLDNLMKEYTADNYADLVTDIINKPEMLGEYNADTKKVMSWWRSMFMVSSSDIDKIVEVKQNIKNLEPTLNAYIASSSNKEELQKNIDANALNLKEQYTLRSNTLLSMPSKEEEGLLRVVEKSLQISQITELKEFIETSPTFSVLVTGMTYTGKLEEQQKREQSCTQHEHDKKSERSEFCALQVLRTKEEQNRELAEIKQIANNHASDIFRKYFGKENQHRSRGDELRFGNKGSIVAYTNGKNAGTWYDFEQGRGGGIIDLIMDANHTDFKGAIEQLKNEIGYISSRSFRDNRQDISIAFNRYEVKQNTSHDANQILKQQEEKIKQANSLYEKADYVFSHTVARQYLKSRKIECSINDDLKTTSVFVKELNKELPALIGFARDFAGRITGGQQIILDPATNKKADIELNKKSFGKISGSFVDINLPNRDQDEQVTIIAEGIETALSIKQAGINAKILCSLGVGNIHNYVPSKNEIVIIAGDNDGMEASSNKAMQRAEDNFKEHTEFTRIIKPTEKGDFNDILKQEGIEKGSNKIQIMFTGTIKELLVTRELNLLEQREYKINNDAIDHIKAIMKYGTKFEQSIFASKNEIKTALNNMEHKTEFVEHLKLALEHAPEQLPKIIKFSEDESMRKSSIMLTSILHDKVNHVIVSAVETKTIDTVLAKLTSTEQRLVSMDSIKERCEHKQLQISSKTMQTLKQLEEHRTHYEQTKLTHVHEQVEHKMQNLSLSQGHQINHSHGHGFSMSF